MASPEPLHLPGRVLPSSHVGWCIPSVEGGFLFSHGARMYDEAPGPVQEDSVSHPQLRAETVL